MIERIFIIYGLVIIAVSRMLIFFVFIGLVLRLNCLSLLYNRYRLCGFSCFESLGETGKGSSFIECVLSSKMTNKNWKSGINVQ